MLLLALYGYCMYRSKRRKMAMKNLRFAAKILNPAPSN